MWILCVISAGCIISEPKQETIIRSPGESVLLHCSCTNLETKLDEFQWSVRYKKRSYNLIGYLTEEEKRIYIGRVQTFNANSPGNASLLLSNLTEEDQGEYQCVTESNGGGTFRDIKLLIQSNPFYFCRILYISVILMCIVYKRVVEHIVFSSNCQTVVWMCLLEVFSIQM